MQRFSISPKEMLRTIVANRYLIKKSVQREVSGRYRGSILGIFWSFFNPLFMLMVYTFIFSVVFQAKWGGHQGSKTEFALILFSGLIIFNFFAECINSAPKIILSNANYVKKVVFPLEILPIIQLGSAGFHFAVSALVWITGYTLFIGIPHITIVFLPFILIPLSFFILGLSWFLASLGVYLRDVSQVISIFVTSLMFLSPIFYSISMLPEKMRIFLYFNPLTPIILQTREVLYWGRAPDIPLLLVYTLIAFLVAWGGFSWFQKTRKGFADVL